MSYSAHETLEKKKEGPSLDARVRILPYIRRRPAGRQPAERIGGPNGSIPDATLQGKLGARRRARAAANATRGAAGVHFIRREGAAERRR